MFRLRRKSALLISRYVNTSKVLHRHDGSKPAISEEPNWNRTVFEAEKIVGNFTTFLDYHFLPKDEIAFNLKKLESSNHPLTKIIDLIYNEGNKTQTWGLVVLLISKAAGHLNVDNKEEDEKTGLLHSQKILAKITVMIRTSHILHNTLVNIQSDKSADLNGMSFGNKLALLSGDYLLANSFAEAANLRNQDIAELAASAIKDLAEVEFIGRRDSQNNPLPSVPPADRTDYAVNEWTLRNILSDGALLGKFCKASLKLAGHDEEIQERGFNFGKHLALTWQARLDLNPFISEDRNIPFNLCSAPVMYHIEHDPSILTEIDKGLESVSNVDYAKIYSIVNSGPGIEFTKQLHREHSDRAMEMLSYFQDNDARTALINIIDAIGDFSKLS